MPSRVLREDGKHATLHLHPSLLSGLSSPNICLHSSSGQGARCLPPPSLLLLTAGPAGSSGPDPSVSLEYVMAVSCLWTPCIPSAWGCLPPLRYETPKNSLDTHACVTEAYGVCAQGNINLTNSKKMKSFLFLCPLSPKASSDRQEIHMASWKLPLRLCSHLVTKLRSALPSCLLWLTLLFSLLLACECTPSQALMWKGFPLLSRGPSLRNDNHYVLSPSPTCNFISFLL